MRRVILILLAIVTAVTATGCSAVRDILGDEKYDKLSGKLTAAWEQVGKDALGELADDAWREFGFGRSLDWPDDSIASSLPKLRSGKIEYSYSAGDGGYIKLKNISDSELDEYLACLGEIGYRKTVETPPFTVLVTFDGTYVGFIRGSGRTCSVIYADSFSRITEICSIAEVK